MADLSEKDSSQPVKIVGADSSGNETNYADVTGEGELKISSFANVSFSAADKTATTTQSLASVGVSNLPNRKVVRIINKGTKDIYYGPTGVTSDLLGELIAAGESVEESWGENIDVYVITKTGTSAYTVWELS